MKTIVAILSAALVALAGVAIHLSRQLDASRKHVADLKAQVDTGSAYAPPVATLATSSSLPITEPAAAAPAAAAAQNVSRMELEESIRASIATRRSPESAAQVKAVMVGMMFNLYPDVGKVLGISRDEVDQLFGVLHEQANRRTAADLVDAASRARAAQSDRDELTSLLGSKYAKWEEYKTDLPTRRQVRDLAAALNAAGTPLSDAQSASLIPAVAAAETRNIQDRENTPRTTPADGTPFRRYSPEGNLRILDAAAAYLTPQQLESYSQVLERALIQETALRNTVNQIARGNEDEQR